MDGKRQYRTLVGVPTKESTRLARSVIQYSLRPSLPPSLPPVSLPPLWSPESLPKYQWFTRHPIVGYPHLQIPKREFLEKKRLQVKHSRYIMGRVDDPTEAEQGLHDSRLGADGIRAASSMWKQWCFYRNFLAVQRARPGYKGLDSMTITYRLPWEDRHCCWPYIKERHGWPWAALIPQGPYGWSPFWWEFRQFGDLPLYCAKKPTKPPEGLFKTQIGPCKSRGGPGFDAAGCDYALQDAYHCN